MKDNNKDYDINQKFIEAVRWGDINEVEELLKSGADVNTKNRLKQSALEVAARFGNIQKVEILLQQLNTEVDFKSLFTALYNGYGDIAFALLNRNPELAKMGVNGDSAMIQTILTDDINIISKLIPMLISYGADVNYRDNEGLSALHLAAYHGLKDACKLLLKQKGIKVDIIDNEGFTPLQLAADGGHIECCEILIEHGADYHIKTQDNKTIIDLCDNLYSNKSSLLEKIIREADHLQSRKRKEQGISNDNAIERDNESNPSSDDDGKPKKKKGKWTQDEDNRRRNGSELVRL